MFSSFDPEVCVEIKTRRPEYHVMFLTGGGAYPHVDPRRTTIDAAIRFAAAEGLQGIIVESLTLHENRDWIQHARQRGLYVLSYGLHNNNMEWVAEQEALGVHGVIVDDVASIANAFTQ
jgi:glycerophosphodiester phosphodiesterase